MKTVFITMEVLLPDNFKEKEIDVALADAIYEQGGEVVNISEYREVANT